MGNFGISAGLWRGVAAGLVTAAAVLSGGCTAKKSVMGAADEVPLLNEMEFFESGLAEVSGQDNIGYEKHVDASRGGVWVFYDDIITGQSGIRTFRPDSVAFHDWIRMPSPRVVTLKRNGFDDVSVYLEKGKRLDISFGATPDKTLFSGELSAVNNDLRDAPRFAAPDSLSALISGGQIKDKDSALSAYEKEESVWKQSLLKYASDRKRTQVGRRILENMPVFTKASWLLRHEKDLDFSTEADYASLREAMAVEDPYMMAGKWPGALVKLIAGSDLLRRLARTGERQKTPSYKEAVMRYMERYDELVRFLGMDGMPRLAQMAVARTLCTGGLLERAGNLEDALAIVDTVAPEYMPSPEVSGNVRKYARSVFHDEDRPVRDTPEGKMLKNMLAKYAGRNVILDFWGYRCPPCLKEMRDTRDMRQSERGNPDWVVVYVTGEDITPRDKYDRIASEQLVGDESFLLKRDDHLRLTAMFEVGEIPRKVLIGRDGKIIDSRYQFIYDENGKWSNRPR